jgi:hypothetical protein
MVAEREKRGQSRFLRNRTYESGYGCAISKRNVGGRQAPEGYRGAEIER